MDNLPNSPIATSTIGPLGSYTELITTLSTTTFASLFGVMQSKGAAMTRHLRKRSRLLCLVAVLPIVAGCTKSQVGSGAFGYNVNLGQAIERIAFLNVMRAAQRRPLHFSSVGNLTSVREAGGSLELTIPFGRNTTNPFSAKPTISGKRGSDTLIFANLNSSDVAHSMNFPVDPLIYSYFYDYGWARDLLFNMFVGRIVVSPTVNKQIVDARLAQCRAPDDERTTTMCTNLTRGMPEATVKEIRDELERGNPFDATQVSFFNSARQPDAYWKFQYFARTLRILRAELRTVGTELVLYIPRGSSLPEILISQSEGQANRVLLRSPVAMIEYLGGHVAAQLYNTDDSRYVPTIGIGASFRPTALFRVRQGSSANSGTISVEFDRQSYHIPNPRSGGNDDRSLQVLSLISQTITLSTNPDKLTGPTQLRLFSN